MDEKRHARIWQALNKYGIKTEADLDRELKKLKPLNIGIMTSQLKEKEAVN